MLADEGFVMNSKASRTQSTKADDTYQTRPEALKYALVCILYGGKNLPHVLRRQSCWPVAGYRKWQQSCRPQLLTHRPGEMGRVETSSGSKKKTQHEALSVEKGVDRIPATGRGCKMLFLGCRLEKCS